jgi:hypothetical protein
MSFGTMIDATAAAIPGLLAALGSNYPDTFASYVTGTPDIDATSQEFAELAAKAGVFRYDQSPALASFAAGLADAADIEAEAGTVDAAVSATQKREAKGWYSWFYVADGSLAATRTAVADAKLSRVRFVVANWNLSQAEAQSFIDANSDVDAVQWASPSSNPNTICPGTTRTLSQLNVDLNVTRAGWFVKQSNTPVTSPTYRGIVVVSDLTTVTVTSSDRKTWTA